MPHEKWELDAMMKLMDLAEKYDMKFSTTQGGRGNPNFADFMIHPDDESMIGFKLNTSAAMKPFILFPYGEQLDFDDIEEFLVGVAMGRDLYNAKN